MKFGEQWEIQFNDFTYDPQVEQSNPVGIQTLGLSVIDTQIEKTAPRIGEDSSTMIAGDIPEEKRHGDGHGCGVDPLADLFRATREVPGLCPRGSGMPGGLVSALLRILIRKRGFQRLRQGDRFDWFSL